CVEVIQESPDRAGDLVTVRLKGEVASVKEAHFSVRNVPLECLCAPRQEKRIVPAPNYEKRRGLPSEVRPGILIKGNVAFVIAEKIQLHFVRAGARQVEAIERISVGRNRGRIGDTVSVLPERCFRRKEGSKSGAIRLRRILPVSPDRGPTVAEPLYI